MSIPKIESVPFLWEIDGSLRDVYFINASLTNWEMFIEFLSYSPIKYSFDGHPQSLPSVSEIFLNRNGHHLLIITIEQVEINCHFFIESEIEVDISPKEIHGQQEHEAVLKFIEYASLATGLHCLITPENCIEHPFLTFIPETKEWTVHS